MFSKTRTFVAKVGFLYALAQLAWGVAILSLLVILLPVNVAANGEPHLLLDKATPSYPLTEAMDILEDPGQTYTFTEVSHGGQQQGFKPFDGESPNFGRTTSALWFRTNLVNPYDQRLTLILEEPLAYLDSIDLYTPFDQKPASYRRRHAGDRSPFAEREILHHRFLFPIELAPHQSMTIYLRVASRVSMITPFRIWLKPAWESHARLLAAAHAAFFSFLLVLALFSSALFLFQRERIYIYFFFFISAVALMAATSQGLAYQYLWPTSPFLAERMQVISINLVMLAGTLYAREFLKTRTNLPRMDRILRLFLGVLATSSILALLLPEVTHLALFSFATIQLYSPLLILSGFLIWRLGEKSARFYMLAWTSSLTGATVAGLTLLGVLPYHFLLLHATLFGFLLDSIFLSLAMADRVNVIRQERDLAQQKVTDTLRETRDQLEQEVERRTHELVVARQDAERANQAKTRFLANMSHELRTPLIPVVGYSDLLLGTNFGKLPSQQRDMVQNIHNSALHLTSLIDNVLDISVIESGQIQVNMTPTAFRSVLNEVLSMLNPLATDKQIQLIDSTEDKPGFVVVADQLRLRQVLINLLSNAIKYSPPNSDVRVCLQHHDGKVRFSVTDTGPGIAASDQERIFKPFTRVEDLAEKVDGVGIGLSITKMLVSLMAGEISVDSKPGQGTSFHVDLVATARNPVAETSRKPLQSSG